jgi:hypothetical protein
MTWNLWLLTFCLTAYCPKDFTAPVPLTEAGKPEQFQELLWCQAIADRYNTLYRTNLAVPGFSFHVSCWPTGGFK